MKGLRKLPSAAMLVAIAALVIGLAGGAYAAKKIDSGDLAKQAVKAKNLAKGAVKTKKVADGAITEAKLADAAVSAAKLAADAVTTAKIADGAVTQPKLGDGAVSTNKILDAAVSSVKILDAAVTTVKIADAAVTTVKIADAAVTRAKIADAAIDSAKVEDKTLTAADLAPGVLDVVAYGKVINPEPGDPTLAPNSVGLTGVTDGTDTEGRTTVSVSSAVLPAGGVPACTVQATAAADAQPSNVNTLGFDSVTVATGSPAPSPATSIQAQTRDDAGGLNDFDYFVQVTCPGV